MVLFESESLNSSGEDYGPDGVIREDRIYRDALGSTSIWIGYIARLRDSRSNENEFAHALIKCVTDYGLDPAEVLQTFMGLNNFEPTAEKCFSSTFHRLRGDMRFGRGDYQQAIRLYCEGIKVILGTDLKLPSQRFLESQYLTPLKWNSENSINCILFVNVVELFNKIAKCYVNMGDDMKVG